MVSGARFKRTTHFEDRLLFDNYFTELYIALQILNVILESFEHHHKLVASDSQRCNLALCALIDTSRSMRLKNLLYLKSSKTRVITI